MPEGHSVHRIALQFRGNFVGRTCTVTSPQGRFAAGAAELDGRELVASSAVGKHLLLGFAGDLTLHVHLGLYGAWDFAGQVSADPTFVSAGGRMGQTNQRGTILGDALPESSLASMGAPRLTRLRMAESEKESALADFPPEPIGQVRVRILTETAVADLRGPTACEVFDPAQVATLLAKLGPDPMYGSGKEAEDRFVAKVGRSATPIGLQLMDQSVVAGIGNVYRAELLFRARLNPHTPGREIPVLALRKLWRDWAHLLEIGVETGQMMTRDDLGTEDAYRLALASREHRHYVYKRTGERSPRGRGTVVMEEMGGRNLYWAPGWQTLPKPKA